ncbi:5-hydroxytryptamine receptor 1A-like [Amphiura filiformis]|uniref:5-hydroxytryptamine receptor 1A-like n=1 Tax=Amphiura filiformis TaxID=82378 RepID=UPI003B213885
MVGTTSASLLSTLVYATYTGVTTDETLPNATEKYTLEYILDEKATDDYKNNSLLLRDCNYQLNPYTNSLVLSVVYAVVFFTALVTNSLVLLVVLRRPKLRSPSNIHLTNLALADLFCSMTVPFAVLSQLEQSWRFDNVSCQIVAFLTIWSCLNIILILIFISIYRFFVITRARSKITKLFRKRCVRFNSTIWPISALFALPPFWGFGGYQDCIGLPGCFLDLPRSKYYTCFFAFTTAFVPLIIMVFCYSRIFETVRKSSKRVKNVAHALFRANSAVVLSENVVIANQPDCDESPNNAQASRRSRGSILELDFLPLPFGRSPRGSDASTTSAAAARNSDKRMSVVSYSSAIANMRPDEYRLGKSLFLVFVTFIFLWLPVVAIMLMESFNTSETPNVGFWVAMHICIYTHAAVNPLVYGLLRPLFVEHYLQSVAGLNKNVVLGNLDIVVLQVNLGVMVITMILQKIPTDEIAMEWIDLEFLITIICNGYQFRLLIRFNLET